MLTGCQYKVFLPACYRKPDCGIFKPTGSMGAARYLPAMPLKNGKVLMGGGLNSVTFANAEIFNPAGNAGIASFTSTGSNVYSGNPTHYSAEIYE